MFTIFELLGTLVGIGLGIKYGNLWFGWVGAIVGAVVGFFAGCYLGRVILVISRQRLIRNLKRIDTATLRSRLESEYFISHLIIAELLVRGEPIESFGEYVSGLLSSESPDRRKFGEQNLRIWPEVALQNTKDTSQTT